MADVEAGGRDVRVRVPDGVRLLAPAFLCRSMLICVVTKPGTVYISGCALIVFDLGGPYPDGINTAKGAVLKVRVIRHLHRLLMDLRDMWII